MIAVQDIDDVVARLGAPVPNWLASWRSTRTAYRLCYVRGPEGILVALAEKVG